MHPEVVAYTGEMIYPAKVAISSRRQADQCNFFVVKTNRKGAAVNKKFERARDASIVFGRYENKHIGLTNLLLDRFKSGTSFSIKICL